MNHKEEAKIEIETKDMESKLSLFAAPNALISAVEKRVEEANAIIDRVRALGPEVQSLLNEIKGNPMLSGVITESDYTPNMTPVQEKARPKTSKKGRPKGAKDKKPRATKRTRQAAQGPNNARFILEHCVNAKTPMSALEVAQKLGITRGRVYQIVAQLKGGQAPKIRIQRAPKAATRTSKGITLQSRVSDWGKHRIGKPLTAETIQAGLKYHNLGSIQATLSNLIRDGLATRLGRNQYVFNAA